LGFQAPLSADDFHSREDFVEPGYSIPSPAGQEALHLMATKEGILLDPTYTAKAAAALIHDSRQGRWSRDDVVVFVHTGGQPAVFALAEQMLAG
jgi:1-aminocyclopropane-1-carboxylate deaminase/D-cysteine desulfhydrase-like pyridoxal-dependent ACC family enzyme